MKERPILFSAPMVRALLAGTKTQTRRVLRVQPPAGTFQVSTWHHPDPRPHFFAWQELPHDAAMIADDWAHPCPYGQPGDRLWVRETFAKIDGQTQPWIATDYRATYTHGDRLGDTLGIRKRWTPAIHMPRAASRIDLEVTGVRVERLQDISEADAIAEGVERSGECNWRDYGDAGNDFTSARRSYRSLWDSINDPSPCWGANPWVWVVSFRRLP